MNRAFLRLLILTIGLTLTLSVRGQDKNQTDPPAGKSGGNGKAAEGQSMGEDPASAPEYVPVRKYDPTRDAEQDVKNAVGEARRTGKRILLIVGGEWCIWCHILDDFFNKHPELSALGGKNFVMLKINFSEENPNARLLSRYPAINGYPHLFVLDRDGKLLQSQDTGGLEEGRSYDVKKFTTFLKQWSPDPRTETSR